MSELEIIAAQCPTEWQRWETNAEKLIQKQGLSHKWLKHGFWRWKNPPPKIRDLALTMGIELQFPDPNETKKPISYNFSFVPDSDLKTQIVKGQFNKPIDLVAAAAFLPALGKVILDLERNIIEVALKVKAKQIQAFLYESGMFTLSEGVTKKVAKKFAQTVLRSMLCTACGTCQSYCTKDAISLDSGRAEIIEEKCVQCEECLRGKCPSLYAQ